MGESIKKLRIYPKDWREFCTFATEKMFYLTPKPGKHLI